MEKIEKSHFKFVIETDKEFYKYESDNLEDFKAKMEEVYKKINS